MMEAQNDAYSSAFIQKWWEVSRFLSNAVSRFDITA